jgi:putative hydrolases of HD superfamily
MISLQNLESFMHLLHKVENVERVARIPDEKEYRSTAEHSFELALLAWYVASSQKLDLDLGKVLRYALAHDVIEAYSGDTPAFDPEQQKTKVLREAEALQRIEKEFPEFSDISATIHEYEERNTPESKFVYALDKLIDPLNASMETTQSIWKEMDVSYAQFLEYKSSKIAHSPDVEIFWNQLKEKLELKKDFFFNT